MAYKFVGYFGNWAQYRQAGGKLLPDQIDPSLFTHINFACCKSSAKLLDNILSSLWLLLRYPRLG